MEDLVFLPQELANAWVGWDNPGLLVLFLFLVEDEEVCFVALFGKLVPIRHSHGRRISIFYVNGDIIWKKVLAGCFAVHLGSH